MADLTAGSTTGGKGFRQAVQKTVFRTKEKVLQNLGKADKTKDDELDQNLELFNEQQNVATRLQKELKRYLMSLKEMSLASQTIYKTIKECFDQNWPGYTQMASDVEHHAVLWEDYVTKMSDLQDFIANYSGRFPDLRAKIGKRGRKLTDYDGARHTHESLLTAKKRDDTKIAKALDDLNEAKSVYESINCELHDELPAFYNSRIGVLASLFSQLLTTEVVFEGESVKLKNSMNEVTKRLVDESDIHDYEYKPRNTDTGTSSSGFRKSTSSVDRSLKLNNIQSQSRAQASQAESASATKQSNIRAATSQSSPPYSTQSSSSSFVLPKSSSHNSHADSETDSSSQRQSVEPSVKHLATSSTVVESETALNDSDEDDDNTENAAASAAIHHDSEVYSFVKDFDEECEYAIPKSNVPVNRPSVVPSDRVLFQVQATHAYVGEDMDELTFEPGDIITVIPYDNPDDQDDGWLMGVKEATREKGVFPENFTRKI